MQPTTSRSVEEICSEDTTSSSASRQPQPLLTSSRTSTNDQTHLKIIPPQLVTNRLEHPPLGIQRTRRNPLSSGIRRHALHTRPRILDMWGEIRLWNNWRVVEFIRHLENGRFIWHGVYYSTQTEAPLPSLVPSHGFLNLLVAFFQRTRLYRPFLLRHEYFRSCPNVPLLFLPIFKVQCTKVRHGFHHFSSNSSSIY